MKDKVNYQKIKVLYIMLGVLAMLSCSSLKKIITGVEPLIDRLEFSRYEVDPGDTLTVRVRVSEGDTPLQYDWEADGGQFHAPVDEATVVWQAPVTGGTYRIRVEVSNDIGEDSESRDVTVRSWADPAVSLYSPSPGEYYAQYTRIDILAQATHDNGIRALRLFINDDLKMTLGGHAAAEYAFQEIELDEAGPAEIRVEAEANTTGAMGVDIVTVNVEGIVIGKPKD